MGGLIIPMLKGIQRVMVGNPIVFINFIPAKNLLCPSGGNTMNALSGDAHPTSPPSCSATAKTTSTPAKQSPVSGGRSKYRSCGYRRAAGHRSRRQQDGRRRLVS